MQTKKTKAIMCDCNLQKVCLIKEKFNQGDLTEIALFAYALNRPEFLSQMKAKGLELSADELREDIKLYTELNRKGEDVQGVIKDKNGNPIKFNFKEMVLNIPVPLKDLKNKIQFI